VSKKKLCFNAMPSHSVSDCTCKDKVQSYLFSLDPDLIAPIVTTTTIQTRTSFVPIFNLLPMISDWNLPAIHMKPCRCSHAVRPHDTGPNAFTPKIIPIIDANRRIRA